MTELVTVQVNVNQLLLEEGGRDNATVETRTMSAIDLRNNNCDTIVLIFYLLFS